MAEAVAPCQKNAQGRLASKTTSILSSEGSVSSDGTSRSSIASSGELRTPSRLRKEDQDGRFRRCSPLLILRRADDVPDGERARSMTPPDDDGHETGEDFPELPVKQRQLNSSRSASAGTTCSAVVDAPPLPRSHTFGGRMPDREDALEMQQSDTVDGTDSRESRFCRKTRASCFLARTQR